MTFSSELTYLIGSWGCQNLIQYETWRLVSKKWNQDILNTPRHFSLKNWGFTRNDVQWFHQGLAQHLDQKPFLPCTRTFFTIVQDQGKIQMNEIECFSWCWTLSDEESHSWHPGFVHCTFLGPQHSLSFNLNLLACWTHAFANHQPELRAAMSEADLFFFSAKNSKKKGTPWQIEVCESCFVHLRLKRLPEYRVCIQFSADRPLILVIQNPRDSWTLHLQDHCQISPISPRFSLPPVEQENPNASPFFLVSDGRERIPTLSPPIFQTDQSWPVQVELKNPLIYQGLWRHAPDLGRFIKSSLSLEWWQSQSQFHLLWILTPSVSWAQEHVVLLGITFSGHLELWSINSRRCLRLQCQEISRPILNSYKFSLLASSLLVETCPHPLDSGTIFVSISHRLKGNVCWSGLISLKKSQKVCLPLFLQKEISSETQMDSSIDLWTGCIIDKDQELSELSIHQSLIQLRRLLCLNDPPYQKVLATKVIPSLMELLEMEPFQKEVIWIFINLSCANYASIETLLNAGLAESLLRFLLLEGKSQNSLLKLQNDCLWCLGNLMAEKDDGLAELMHTRGLAVLLNFYDSHQLKLITKHLENFLYALSHTLTKQIKVLHSFPSSLIC